MDLLKMKLKSYTIPFPHLSHKGTFGTLPAPADGLVTGALTLLVPVGRPSVGEGRYFCSQNSPECRASSTFLESEA